MPLLERLLTGSMSLLPNTYQDCLLTPMRLLCPGNTVKRYEILEMVRTVSRLALAILGAVAVYQVRPLLCLPAAVAIGSLLSLPATAMALGTAAVLWSAQQIVAYKTAVAIPALATGVLGWVSLHKREWSLMEINWLRAISGYDDRPTHSFGLLERWVDELEISFSRS